MVDVSIIVVAWNVRDEVLDCLASIERHAGPLTTETIFVDNGSSDGSADAVVEAFPDVRVVRRESNEGLVARNYGLRLAAGRYRMFLDSDAVLTPGALEELVGCLEACPEVGLVAPKLVYRDGTLQLSARRFPGLLLPLMRRPPLGSFLDHNEAVRHHLMADFSHDSAREVEYVMGACQLFRATVQQAVGEIDNGMFFGPDDADWCFRIRMAGFQVIYFPAATVIHDYRRSTARKPFSRAAVRHLRAYYRFQWKWRRHRSRLAREGRDMDLRAVGDPAGGQSRPREAPASLVPPLT